MARIARKTKRIICILVCCVLVMAHMGTSRKVKAEALPEVASGSTTIADIVLTYYSTVGAGISNVEVINKLSQDLGTNFGTIESFAEQGMLVQNESTGAWEPVSELVTAIENTSAYQSLGLDQIFNVSAQEAAAGGGLAASGAATLAGAAGGVASIGALPLFAGVSASYWAGIGAGTLISHLIQEYAPQIYFGSPLNISSDNITSKAIAGGSCSLGIYQNYYYYVSSIGVPYAYHVSGKTWNIGVYNLSGSDQNYSIWYYNLSTGKNSSATTGTVSNNLNISNERNFDSIVCSNKFESQSEFNKALKKWKSGELKPNGSFSPDVIGENGNQQGSYKNGQYTVPDFKPQIDPGTEAAKPISVQDWLNFANSVKNNNSQVDPLPDNARAFQDMIDTMRIGLPSPGPSPDPDPDPYPDPNPNPDPTPVPDPDYGDPNPDQPESEHQTESTEKPDPVDTGRPWMLPDLSKKFPFCIPWDIGKMFGKLKVNSREAPHISWRFNPPGTPVDYTFNLDLEDYENVASLLRSLELIAFIVGLAFATRYLIGAT